MQKRPMKTQVCESFAGLVRVPCVTLVGLALLGSLQQAAAQGTAFNYSGILDDNGGLATGVYDFTFSLSSNSNELMQVGATITNAAVAVANGSFSVTLDFGVGVFTGHPLWVEIGVRTNGAGNFSLLNPCSRSRRFRMPSWPGPPATCWGPCPPRN